MAKKTAGATAWPCVGTAGLPTGQAGLFLGVKERAVAVCCSYQVLAEDGAQVTKAARRWQNALSSAVAQAQVRSRCKGSLAQLSKMASPGSGLRARAAR